MRFFCYFKESVVESRLENMRVRKLTICYYLEDKSIMITEPKQTNSGVPQGHFLKRQVVIKANGCPYMPEDFAIGTDVAIFGRAMRIYDADQYTREFYQVSAFGYTQVAHRNNSHSLAGGSRTIIREKAEDARQLQFQMKWQFKPASNARSVIQPHVNFQTLCVETRKITAPCPAVSL